MSASFLMIFESTKKLPNLTSHENRLSQFLLPCFLKMVDIDSYMSIIVTIH